MMSNANSRPLRRVLLVAEQQGNKSDGGLESATRIFEALARDFEWSLFTTHESHFTDRWRALGADVMLASFRESAGIPHKAWNFTVWAFNLYRVVKERKIELMHANDPRSLQVAGVVARLLNIPLLFTVRDTKPEGESYGRHWQRAGAQCIRIVTLSNEMGDTLVRRAGMPRDRLITIPSIVDLQRYTLPTEQERTKARSSLGIREGEFAIGFIGVFRDKKNPLEFIEHSLPVVLDQVPFASVHFFGDYHPETNSYARHCADAIARLGAGQRVVIHGHCDDMTTVYRALDAIVVGSRYEGLARCMIEGMSSGVPIISFDVCSARETLDKSKAGSVFLQGDYVGLSKELIQLANDPSMRSALGARGRVLAEERFDSRYIARRYRDLYREALAD